MLSGQPIRPIELRAANAREYALLSALQNRLLAECLPDDPPTPLEDHTRSWRNLPPFLDVFDHLILSADGTFALASGAISLPRTDENRHVAYVGIGVLPECRRQGLARRLLAPIADLARRDGRRLLLISTNARVPAGEAFMRRLGAKAGQQGHTNQLDLADLDRDLLGRWLTEGPLRARGFELGLWTGEYPEAELATIAALHGILNQAPRGDFDVEDRQVTPEQLRQMEASNRASGTERWTLYARVQASGAFAGFTEVFWHPSHPAMLSQGITGVFQAHRHRGLGRWLKAAMLDKVLRDRSEVRLIRTSNADSNAAMLAINHALGFRPHPAETFWQVETDAVFRYLDART